MNARDAKEIEWSSVQGALMEEYEKRKDKNKRRIDEALFSSGGDENWRYRRGNNRGGRGGFSNSRGRGAFNNNRGGYSNRGGVSIGNNRGQQGRPTPYTRFTGSCFHCHNVGHKANECPELRQNDGEEASVAEIFHEDDFALLVAESEDLNEVEVKMKIYRLMKLFPKMIIS